MLYVVKNDDGKYLEDSTGIRLFPSRQAAGCAVGHQTYIANYTRRKHTYKVHKYLGEKVNKNLVSVVPETKAVRISRGPGVYYARQKSSGGVYIGAKGKRTFGRLCDLKNSINCYDSRDNYNFYFISVDKLDGVAV